MNRPQRLRMALIDLDGTLYRGDSAILGADAFVRRLRQQGVAPVFFTNNATRTPEQVCDKLAYFDIDASPSEVCTSAQAAASYLIHRVPQGAPVVYVGTGALAVALKAEGYEPILADGAVLAGTAGQESGVKLAQAAVLGLDTTVNYLRLAEFCQVVSSLGWFVLTNADVRLPYGDAFWPGNGALGSFVTTATGIQPMVTGKPSKGFVEYACQRYGISPEETVIIGDNLRTDVLAGLESGVYTIHVLTGVQYVEFDAPHQPDEVHSSVAELFLS